MITRFSALALLVSLAACAAPRSLVPDTGAPSTLPSSSAPLALRPNHGASALPGGWLPCGWPNGGDGQGGEGGDVTGAPRPHEASCSVAVSTGQHSLRNSDDWPGQSLPGLHPSDLAAAYGFPIGAAGMTVAVVDAFDDPSVESDLGVYRAKFNLPACTSANGCFKKVNQGGKGGPFPRANVAWSHEIALDVEMISAVCPRCPILLVEAKSASLDDLGAAVDRAVALGARVVSNSYYAVEWPTEAKEDAHFNHPGVAITVSSGDQAAAPASGGDDAVSRTQSTRERAPYYPASSPYVTSVGGTSLFGREGGGFNEMPWQYGGDGCSRYESRPAFQIPICATRSSVDLAVVGDPQTGVSLYVSQAGGWVVAGGTSVGAPIVAAAYALSGNPAGPAFSYGHRGAFRNVGTVGFDRATGLGSPNGVAGL